MQHGAGGARLQGQVQVQRQTKPRFPRNHIQTFKHRATPATTTHLSPLTSKVVRCASLPFRSPPAVIWPGTRPFCVKHPSAAQRRPSPGLAPEPSVSKHLILGSSHLLPPGQRGYSCSTSLPALRIEVAAPFSLPLICLESSPGTKLPPSPPPDLYSNCQTATIRGPGCPGTHISTPPIPNPRTSGANGLTDRHRKIWGKSNVSTRLELHTPQEPRQPSKPDKRGRLSGDCVGLAVGCEWPAHHALARRLMTPETCLSVRPSTLMHHSSYIPALPCCRRVHSRQQLFANVSVPASHAEQVGVANCKRCSMYGYW